MFFEKEAQQAPSIVYPLSFVIWPEYLFRMSVSISVGKSAGFWLVLRVFFSCVVIMHCQTVAAIEKWFVVILEKKSIPKSINYIKEKSLKKQEWKSVSIYEVGSKSNSNYDYLLIGHAMDNIFDQNVSFQEIQNQLSQHERTILLRRAPDKKTTYMGWLC